jgi:hypothetical protein
MTQAEYELLTRIEQGQSVFRPSEPDAHAFDALVALLLKLRGHGWIRLPEGRIARDGGGRPLMVGPCDLTEAGRWALAQDRSLGPRP